MLDLRFHLCRTQKVSSITPAFLQYLAEYASTFNDCRYFYERLMRSSILLGVNNFDVEDYGPRPLSRLAILAMRAVR